MKYDADWMSSAACREWTQQKFFPEEGSRNEEWRWRAAVKVCERCPVRRQCLEFALKMERAGSLPLGTATFIKGDWVPDHTDSCAANCKDMKHWRRRSNDVTLATGQFTASFTPPVGVWGGTTPPQRHAKEIKHLVLKAGQCILGPRCTGCRPLDEWVDELMEAS